MQIDIPMFLGGVAVILRMRNYVFHNGPARHHRVNSHRDSVGPEICNEREIED